jgi:hypothetical protein
LRIFLRRFLMTDPKSLRIVGDWKNVAFSQVYIGEDLVAEACAAALEDERQFVKR